MQLVIANEYELQAAFEALGTRVGRRRGPDRRTKDQKEWYSLRLYLLTLGAHKLLSYPLTIDKSERPDFIMSDRISGRYGIEVTEATEQDWQRELTETEWQEGEDPAEAIPIDTDGVVGEFPEQQWCQSVFSAIERKLVSLNNPNYSIGSCDLLVYVSSRMSVFATNMRAFELLLSNSKQRGALWSRCSRLGRVAILGGSLLLSDLRTGGRILPVLP